MTGRELIEFPPVLCRRSLYLQKNNGALYKISRLTGRVRWKAKIGYLAASSPACAGSSVYAVVLARGKGIKAGRVIALDAKNGRVRWSRKLPSRAESSPLVASGRVYFGTEDGTVYALRARDGARALALQGRRRGQGRARARPGAPVLRRLRRQGPRHPPARRLADLGDVERRHGRSG